MQRGVFALLTLCACGPTASAGDGSSGSEGTTVGTSPSSTSPTTSSTGTSTTSGDGWDGAGKGDIGGIPDLGSGPAVDCPLDWGPTSQVAGATYIGDNAWPYAWYSFRVSLGTGTATPFIRFARNLEEGEAFIVGDGYTFLDATVELPEPWLGTGPSEMTVFDFDFGGSNDGTITITELDGWPDDPDESDWPRAVGSLEATTNDWSLQGEFVAPWCVALAYEVR